MMNPKIVATALVTSLLAASLLCVGTRHIADQRRMKADAISRITQSTMVPVVSPQTSARRKEADAPETRQEVLARRLRSVLAAASFAERERGLLELAGDLSPDEWPLALEALEEMGMREGGPEQLTLLSAWVEKDVTAALAWTEKYPHTKNVVLGEWLGQDPDAALDHLLSTWEEAVGPSHEALVNAAADLAADPQRLSRLVGALPDQFRRMALSYAKPVFAAEDPEAVGKWLDAFDPALRGEMLSFRMKGLSRFEDKNGLAHAFEEDMGPEHYRPLYKEWAVADKEAATAALESMEPGPVRKAAYEGIVFGLCDKSRMAESVEVFRAYPEYANERLLNELLLNFNVKDAELLLSLVPEIKDPDMRLNRYYVQLNFWLGWDAPAARKWMEENEVPEQVRRQLAKP